MNARAKGHRLERAACAELVVQGYRVFRLYQPRGTAQHELDMIAVGHGYVRFVQVRANQWHDLRALRAFQAAHGSHNALVPTVEVWMRKDGERAFRQRVME